MKNLLLILLTISLVFISCSNKSTEFLGVAINQPWTKATKQIERIVDEKLPAEDTLVKSYKTKFHGYECYIHVERQENKDMVRELTASIIPSNALSRKTIFNEITEEFDNKYNLVFKNTYGIFIANYETIDDVEISLSMFHEYGDIVLTYKTNQN